MVTLNPGPIKDIKVLNGYRKACHVLNHKDFPHYFLANTPNKLTYTKAAPSDIFMKIIALRNGKYEIKLDAYWYRGVHVLGMTNGTGKIYINTNAISYFSEEDYLGNCLHEIGHEPLGYRHGSNFPNGWKARLMGDFANKDFAVPQLLDSVGTQFYKDHIKPFSDTYK